MSIDELVKGIRRIEATDKFKEDIVFLVRIAYSVGYNDANDDFLNLIVNGDPSGMIESVIGMKMVHNEMRRRAEEEDE